MFSSVENSDFNSKTNANTNLDIENNSLTMAITNNLNMNNLSKFLDFDEFVNVKRLEKGLRSIFVPHSPGVYVSINLNPTPIDSTTNFDENYDINKYYKCNAILNVDSLDAELKELLMYNKIILFL